MNYRIEEHGPFRIVGTSVPLTRDMAQNFQAIPAKWGEVAANGTLQKLVGLMDAQPRGVLGVSICNDREPWRYYIAVASNSEAGDLEEYTVPAATWAIFSGEGAMSAGIQELERRVGAEWLPSSGYAHGDAPDLEVYMNAGTQNAKYEVWIPVVKCG